MEHIVNLVELKYGNRVNNKSTNSKLWAIFCYNNITATCLEIVELFNFAFAFIPLHNPTSALEQQSQRKCCILLSVGIFSNQRVLSRGGYQ